MAVNLIVCACKMSIKINKKKRSERIERKKVCNETMGEKEKISSSLEEPTLEGNIVAEEEPNAPQLRNLSSEEDLSVDEEMEMADESESTDSEGDDDLPASDYEGDDGESELDDDDDDEYDGIKSSVAGAMASVLGKAVEEEGAPILLKDRTTDKRVLEEKEERRAKRQRREEKREKRERGHEPKPNVLVKDHERKLLKIATKGMVKLFNAVSKHQKEVSAVVDGAGPSHVQQEKAVSSLKKKDFVDMLKKAPSTGPEGSGLIGDKKVSDQQKGWGVLNDKYMMDSKQKDWDKEDNEDSEEDLEVQKESASQMESGYVSSSDSELD